MALVKFQRLAVLAVGCALLLLSLPAPAQATSTETGYGRLSDQLDDYLQTLLGHPGQGADRVLEAQLKAAGYQFTEDLSGDFYVSQGILPNGEGKRVFVDSHLRKLRLESIRVMYIKITPAFNRVDGELALDLLKRNKDYSMGAWQVVCREEDCYPVFQIEVEAHASTDYLSMAVQTCFNAADAVARDWHPKRWLGQPAKSDL
jgi:hypothetical protein